MPTRDTPWPNGTPCWVDIGVPDVEAAKVFYSTLFGWQYTGGAAESGGYLNAEKDGRRVAGVAPQQDPDDPPRWTTYFATDDAAAAVDRVRAAGGRVLVAPMEVGPVGTFAILLDPQGNVFGLWQAGEHTGYQLHNEPGSLAWNEAMTDDAPAARRFYAEVFGFRFDELPPEQAEDGLDYTTFSTGGNPLGGLGASDPSMPKGWQTCFAVASTDDAVALVEAHGGKVIVPPENTPFGRFAIVEDPWGAAFEVLEDTTG
ncbi:UNVERIFIED_ORG: VOC family protein [Bacillus sp. AZ43]